MERSVNNIVSQQHYSDIDDATQLPQLYDFEYRLPPLPKVSVIANVNAAILAAILAVTLTLLDQHKFIDTVIYFSGLIPCFTFGAIVAVLSCFFDYRARTIYNKSISKKLLLIDIGEIHDACALWIFVASLTIFTWGCYLTFYLLRNAFA